MRFERLLLTVGSLVLAAAGGCAQNDTTLPNLGGPQLTGAPGVMKSPAQQATEGASEVLTSYYAVLSRVLTGAADPAELNSSVSADYLGQITKEIEGLRGPDVTITGSVRPAKFSPGLSIVAPQDANRNPIPGEAKVELKVCEDRTALKVEGAPADKVPPQTRLRRYVLINRAWPAPGWTIERQLVPFADYSCDKAY